MSKILISLLFISFISFSISSLRDLSSTNKRRRAGILMHITSLPSNYGIGTLGVEAYNFADWLVFAKQSFWQILTIGPTGFRDSPYKTFSSNAGNPYMIDLDELIKENLLKEDEVKSVFWGNDTTKVDFDNMFAQRFPILEKAFSRFKPNQDYEDFCQKNKDWLDDYALFMSVKEKFENKKWTEWPDEDIKLRKAPAIEKYTKELEQKINFHKFLQFKFFEQFNKLKNYCHQKGIKLIGDAPIYVALDSMEVWLNPDLFQLDENLVPIAVAGVPPDAFSSEGQLWGNPLYDWDKMSKDDFKWFINRLKITGELFDVIRIDHFRGLESYYRIPYGETAKNGTWIKGPDMGLVKAIHKYLPNLEFIAEDLGYITPEVHALRDGSGYPGIKILEFAFNAWGKSDYLPHNYNDNTVCYAANHDNEVLVEWEKNLLPEDRNFAEKYLGLKKNGDLRKAIIRAGMASVSNLFIAQMQDYLGLGGESRMNRPGTMDGKNWIWRAAPKQINDSLAREISHLTKLYARDY